MSTHIIRRRSTQNGGSRHLLLKCHLTMRCHNKFQKKGQRKNCVYLVCHGIDKFQLRLEIVVIFAFVYSHVRIDILRKWPDFLHPGRYVLRSRSIIFLILSPSQQWFRASGMKATSVQAGRSVVSWSYWEKGVVGLRTWGSDGEVEGVGRTWGRL